MIEQELTFITLALRMSMIDPRSLVRNRSDDQLHKEWRNAHKKALCDWEREFSFLDWEVRRHCPIQLRRLEQFTWEIGSSDLVSRLFAGLLAASSRGRLDRPLQLALEIVACHTPSLASLNAMLAHQSAKPARLRYKIIQSLCDKLLSRWMRYADVSPLAHNPFALRRLNRLRLFPSTCDALNFDTPASMEKFWGLFVSLKAPAGVEPICDTVHTTACLLAACIPQDRYGHTASGCDLPTTWSSETRTRHRPS